MDILHESIRYTALESMVVVTKPETIYAGWYTCDLSAVLGIPNSVAVCTKNCKHETPYVIYIGKRGKNFMEVVTDRNFKYDFEPLGREVTKEEKNKIYDKM